MRGREAVSPTAHYTGYVWVRNGLSHPALATTAFVRGPVYLHFSRPDEVVAKLLDAGFRAAEIRPAGELGVDRGAQLAHVLEASTA
jgi:hypothetical protein